MPVSRAGLLLAQMDEVYDRLRGRLEGLTDDEYLWEPAPLAWSVRDTPDGPRFDFGLMPVTLGGQEAHGLRDEQRVSLRARVDGLDHSIRSRPACAQPDVVRDLLAPQPAQRDARHHGLLDELGERAIERLPGDGLGVAVRGEHHDAGVTHRAREELQ